MSAPPPVAPNPLLASTSMPAWSTVVIDSLLGSGVVTAEEIEDLTTGALVEVASEFVRASASAFNAPEAIAEARQRLARQRRWEVRRKARRAEAAA